MAEAEDGWRKSNISKGTEWNRKVQHRWPLLPWPWPPPWAERSEPRGKWLQLPGRAPGSETYRLSAHIVLMYSPMPSHTHSYCNKCNLRLVRCQSLEQVPCFKVLMSVNQSPCPRVLRRVCIFWHINDLSIKIKYQIKKKLISYYSNTWRMFQDVVSFCASFAGFCAKRVTIGPSVKAHH